MVGGAGRCEGYTQAYSLLLARAGIDNEFVESSAMNHAWNKVCLDGVYYNVDVTWDDPYPPDFTGMVFHSYFLVSDESFESGNIKGVNSAELHTGYSSTTPTGSGYDESKFHEFGSKIVAYNGSLYAMDNCGIGNNNKQLLRYSLGTDRDGHLRLKAKLVWTEKGRQFITDILKG
jgi:hypothetical protein